VSTLLARCEALLGQVFGYAGLRPAQREVLEALEQGRDVLAVMPTGSGKSLCYQLPALAADGGLTLVISPLQALMRDQVSALQRRGVRGVDFLNGLMSPDEQAACLAELTAGALKLLYVAPERFASTAFLRALEHNALHLVAIDEAHCISQWGHDFRPEYRELAPLLAKHPRALRLALTATATPRVREDIVRSLGLRSAHTAFSSADRPNLRLEVEPCAARQKEARILALAKEIDGPFIVYAGKRADAEDLAAALVGARHRAVAYHAGMPAERRLAVQDAFLAGERRIICATIAFGMGIDKPDVRAVIHHRHPAALEGYYQEAGRAGRDGEPARCILLAAEKDASLHRFFISNGFPTLEEHRRIYALLRQGVVPDQMEATDDELTPSKVKVALRTLEAAGFVIRDGWSYRTAVPAVPRPLDLSRHDAQRAHALTLLQHMVDYAQSADCLRARILRYFGEAPPARCGNCSVCLGRATTAPKKRRRRRASGPDCPDCEGPMRRRENKRGESFWGCKRYPLCRGTVDIPGDPDAALAR